MHDTQEGGRWRARWQRLLPPLDPQHRYPRVTSARILASLFDVLVGLRLLLPDTILDQRANPNFRLVALHFHSDWVLGLLLLILGATMVGGLYTDQWTRVVGAATWLALLVWLVIAADLLAVSVSLLGPMVYALVVALHGFAYAHLMEWREQQRRAARHRAEIEREIGL